MKLYISLLVLLFIHNCTGNFDYNGWINIKLQHSFGLENEKYSDRGNIIIQNIISSTIEQLPLNDEDMTVLHEIAKDDDFYKLKSIVQGPDGSENIFYSSIKSKILLESNLHDTIRVWILNNGGVAAVSISPPIVDVINRNHSLKFSSQVFIHHIEQAPVPDTASYIQKLEREREAREKGEFKDNRSFLAKYWMYIVPVVIFILISGAANPEQGGAR